MAYKDKDKQREANRAIQARRRAKGVTGCDTKGVTNQGVTASHGGACTRVTPDLDIRAGFDKAKMQGLPKRGKDIKCFEDLPPDVQQTIDSVSENEHEHKVRTAIAINYQHEFPDRYYSTAVTSGWKDGWRQEHERSGVAVLLGAVDSTPDLDIQEGFDKAKQQEQHR